MGAKSGRAPNGFSHKRSKSQHHTRLQTHKKVMKKWTLGSIKKRLL